MKILYDHQIFSLQNIGGISRYYFELINALNSNTNCDLTLPLLFSNNELISNNDNFKHKTFVKKINFEQKIRLIYSINSHCSRRSIQKGNYDLFHPTYYDTYFLNYIDSKPFVLTVYDMIHEKFKESFSPNDKIAHNKMILIKKASKIIAISENTKRDIIDLFDIDEGKIDVIYLGNSMRRYNASKLNINLPQKYILFVGLRGGYKNFNRFINSVSKVLYKDINLSIVCVGGGTFNDNEIHMFEKIGIKNRVLQFNQNDEMLAKIYNEALLFIFPSLYEGFGIPILEAFACKCPIVCSNTSSLPEIAQDGAEYFNPYSKNSIYNAINNVLENKEIRNNLVANGTEILKHFSWEKTAIKTKEVYESVLK